MPRTTSRAGATALLLHGEERFLVDEKARATLDAWRQELISDFGLETLEGSGLTAARLQDAVLQAPFLDPYRVVYVRMLPANRAEGLAPAIQQIPPTTRLLITVAGRIGATNKLAKAMSSAGGTVEETQHLNRRALNDWAAKRAVEKHGLTPFKLTDNLLPKPTAAALEIARNLTRSGLQPTSVAYRMARHIALVLEVKARQERGESLQQVQDDMPEHNFVLQKAFDTAQQANEERLEQALKQIRDYEWEVKSGQVDADLGLDVLLTRL